MRKSGPTKRVFSISVRKILTDDEQRMLMVHLRKQAVTMPGRRLQLMCDILLNTGLRIRELCQLRVQDTPEVLGKNVIEVYMGKGKKDRTIPVSPRLARAIAKYIRQVRPKTLPRHVRRSDTSRPIFYSNLKRPYLHRARGFIKDSEAIVRTRVSVSIYRMLQTQAAAAGIVKSVNPHMFRHTFAVNMLRSKDDGGAGIDIYTLQNLMGHSSITTTQKYLHLVAGYSNGLGERMDRDFSEFL